jgi:hypothetical protein
MNLPRAPQNYDATEQAQMRRILEAEDKKNLKAGQVLDKLLFRDTATGTVRTVVVTGGALVVT